MTMPRGWKIDRAIAPAWRGRCVAAALAAAAVTSACGSRGDHGRAAAPGEKVGMPTDPSALRAPDSFASIEDRDERARALFVEASRAFLHPRCVNCHPAGDSPLQGDEQRLHDPPVQRGASDDGLPALRCATCHQDHNLVLARVPGAPKWRLAAREMAWQAKTPASLCEQLKDPARNGNRTLAQVLDHVANDKLIAWGWAPGSGRAPAPGTQAQLGALVSAWIDAGAACPQPLAGEPPLAQPPAQNGQPPAQPLEPRK